MDDINKIATADSPEIKFYDETKTLLILGNSYPENCTTIYDPVIKFILNYNVSEQKALYVDFYFNLINSTSIVYVSKLILTISNLANVGLDVQIKWRYDKYDEELLDLGEKFSSISNLPFEYIPMEIELEDE